MPQSRDLYGFFNSSPQCSYLCHVTYARGARDSPSLMMLSDMGALPRWSGLCSSRFCESSAAFLSDLFLWVQLAFLHIWLKTDSKKMKHI